MIEIRNGRTIEHDGVEQNHLIFGFCSELESSEPASFSGYVPSKDAWLKGDD
jgi:hypothetical protein